MKLWNYHPLQSHLQTLTTAAAKDDCVAERFQFELVPGLLAGAVLEQIPNRAVRCAQGKFGLVHPGRVRWDLGRFPAKDLKTCPRQGSQGGYIELLWMPCWRASRVTPDAMRCFTIFIRKWPAALIHQALPAIKYVAVLMPAKVSNKEPNRCRAVVARARA